MIFYANPCNKDRDLLIRKILQKIKQHSEQSSPNDVRVEISKKFFMKFCIYQLIFDTTQTDRHFLKIVKLYSDRPKGVKNLKSKTKSSFIYVRKQNLLKLD